FEPYYYGDEMIYMNLGQGMKQGLTLYKDVYDNKPPLLYLTAMVSGNLFGFKAILAFWSIATIVVFWNLARVLFEKNEKIQKIATIVFALLTTLPLLEGPIANAELFMIGLTLLAFLILLGNSLNPKRLFFAGTLFGIAALFKIPAAFDLPIIVVYWLITKGFDKWKEVLRDTVYLSIGFLSPILLTFGWYFMRGALPEYIKAAFLQNVGYVSSFRPGDVQKPFLVRNAPLLMRAFLVFLGSSVVFLFRKKLTNKFMLFCLWTLFSLFAVTLSERPYPHYLIQSAAPIAFLMAMLFAQRTIEQSLSVLPLALTLFVPFYYKFYSYPTGAYYARFIKFATGSINKETYFNQFSPNTNRNYAIADFLVKSTMPNEKVFMWDNDSPTVYALSRKLPPVKYVADYHVIDYWDKKEMAKALAQNMPKFIILTSNHPLPEIYPMLSTNYILIQQIENAEIWSRVDLAPTK
ncbi:MAG: hypothetical protein ACHQUA_00850, partial [Microgenomates group bacterium]